MSRTELATGEFVAFVGLTLGRWGAQWMASVPMECAFSPLCGCVQCARATVATHKLVSHLAK
jgi:hypothetical protein